MLRRSPTTVFLAEGLQRIPLTTLSKHGPCVGIWWHNDERIVAIAQTLQSFAAKRQIVDCNLCHVHEWPLVAKMLNQSLSADYFIVPRGRVLFDRQREMGFIYHGNSTRQSQLQRIAKLFGLSEWEAAIDDHYLMGNAADELFSDWESPIDDHYLMSEAADELLSEE
ncbi:MAG: hypothetical protein NT013_24155 [Planctomycetia bacterium]|nr:hypothetical protein [Planctomycetia bacterium]